MNPQAAGSESSKFSEIYTSFVNFTNNIANQFTHAVKDARYKLIKPEISADLSGLIAKMTKRVMEKIDFQSLNLLFGPEGMKKIKKIVEDSLAESTSRIVDEIARKNKTLSKDVTSTQVIFHEMEETDGKINSPFIHLASEKIGQKINSSLSPNIKKISGASGQKTAKWLLDQISKKLNEVISPEIDKVNDFEDFYLLLDGVTAYDPSLFDPCSQIVQHYYSEMSESEKKYLAGKGITKDLIKNLDYSTYQSQKEAALKDASFTKITSPIFSIGWKHKVKGTVREMADKVIKIKDQLSTSLSATIKKMTPFVSMIFNSGHAILFWKKAYIIARRKQENPQTLIQKTAWLVTKAVLGTLTRIHLAFTSGFDLANRLLIKNWQEAYKIVVLTHKQKLITDSKMILKTESISRTAWKCLKLVGKTSLLLAKALVGNLVFSPIASASLIVFGTRGTGGQMKNLPSLQALLKGHDPEKEFLLEKLKQDPLNSALSGAIKALEKKGPPSIANISFKHLQNFGFELTTIFEKVLTPKKEIAQMEEMISQNPIISPTSAKTRSPAK